MESKFDLAVVILTFELSEKLKKIKYTPKVCHKINDKTMIEIAVDTASKLEPSLIIILVSKYNITHINKALKYSEHSKLISFCMVDNSLLSESNMKISLAKKCYENKNLLVIPGYCPLLSVKTLFRIISSNSSNSSNPHLIKIKDNLFYLPKELLDKVDKINGVGHGSTHGFDNNINELELREVNTLNDLEEIKEIIEKRKKAFSSIRKK